MCGRNFGLIRCDLRAFASRYPIKKPLPDIQERLSNFSDSSSQNSTTIPPPAAGRKDKRVRSTFYTR